MKLKRIFVSIMALFCAMSFTCCTNEDGKASSNLDQVESFESLAYVQTFDDYKDMYNCGFVNFFGKVDLSDEYVANGTSAKVQIQQVIAYRSNPCMHIALNRDDYGYNYSDLSMIETVGFYVYNANEFEGTLNFKIVGEDGTDLINEFYTIAPRQAENIRIRIDRTFMKLNDVPAAKLRFDINAENNSVWYFDDVYVERAYQPISIENRAFDTDNLLDFNNLNDVNYIVKDSVVKSTAHVVNYQIVADAGIVKDSGALKVDFLRQLKPNGDYTIHPAYYYSGIALGKTFNKNFNFTQLWAKDLCVDVYSTMNKPMTFILRITDGVGTTFDKEYTIEPHEWQTLKVNFNDCGTDTTMRLEHISEVAVYVKYQEMDGDVASFYLDNIRLEAMQG